MKDFTESMRYEYPLTKDSVVIDLGCHVGSFAKTIVEKYDCHVLAFEPIKEFWEKAVENLKDFKNVRCYNFGIGSYSHREKFAIRGDSSGMFSTADRTEYVQILSLGLVLNGYDLDEIDLLKINIEGGEFEVLEGIIKSKKQKVFKNIQVQFHKVVPNFEKRYQKIREELLKTHQLTYEAPWCWENYERI